MRQSRRKISVAIPENTANVKQVSFGILVRMDDRQQAELEKLRAEIELMKVQSAHEDWQKLLAQKKMKWYEPTIIAGTLVTAGALLGRLFS